MPLPGRPPPSAPKMAGFIPLVYNTYQRTFLWPNVLFFPCFYHPPLPAIDETYSRKRLFQPSDPCDCKSTNNSSICLFCEKKSVAEAKIFFLVIQSDFLSRPHHAPFLPSVRLKIIQFTGTSFCWIRGVSLLHGCRLPRSRSLGEKSWTRSSSGKKSIFPQIARCSTRARLPKNF